MKVMLDLPLRFTALPLLLAVLRFAEDLAMSPPLGLEIMHVNVLAFADVGDRLADVLAVFPHGVAVLDVGKRDLVADRNSHLRLEPERGIVGGDHARHRRAGLEALDHDNADRILLVVHEELRNAHRPSPVLVGATYKEA